MQHGQLSVSPISNAVRYSWPQGGLRYSVRQIPAGLLFIDLSAESDIPLGELPALYA